MHCTLGYACKEKDFELVLVEANIIHLVQRYAEGNFMLGVVNRYWKHIVRSADDYFNKWLVTYDELPRDEEKFPGNSPEYYPDYIGTWREFLSPTNDFSDQNISQQL